MDRFIAIGRRSPVIGALLLSLLPPPVEFFVESFLAAIFFFPFAPREAEGEREIVIHIAAV